MTAINEVFYHPDAITDFNLIGVILSFRIQFIKTYL